MSLLSQNQDFLAALNCGCPNCVKEAEDIASDFEHRCLLEAVKSVEQYSEHSWSDRVRKRMVARNLTLLTGTHPVRWSYLGKTITSGQAARLLAKAYEDGIGVLSRGSRESVVKA